MAKNQSKSSLYTRIENMINAYIGRSIEVSPGVQFSQHDLLERIYRFKNRNLSGSKLNADLSYNYFSDIISPRIDSEVKNLRFDSKHILLFSQNPRKDFAAIFLSNAYLKSWLSDNGEDVKLKSAVEEFVANGNIGFKRIGGGYEIVDPLNTYITNQKAETIEDTDIIERHEMTASQIKRMEGWDQEVADDVIKNLSNKTFKASETSSDIETSASRYEIYEFTGEVSEREFNEVQGKGDGEEHKYILAKIIVAGLHSNKSGKKYVLYAEELVGSLSDWYKYAHRGRYENRFWRVGMYEMLFDHQIRANEIVNDLSRGLNWASKVIFKTGDDSILENVRADLENGDIIRSADLAQVDVRMRNLDQLIADWNRLITDADRLSNSQEVVRGESMPSGTPFRMGILLDQNAGKLFAYLRQKLTLPYKQVFKDWILPDLLSDIRGVDIFRFTGDEDILEQLRVLMAENWYMKNLIKIGPHPKEMAEAIKAEKIQELQKKDPAIKNVKDIWKGILPRVLITITGENSDIQDQMQDMMTFIQLEQDPSRIEWLLDTMYRVRGIPIPPKKKKEPQQGKQMLQNIITGGAGEQSKQPPEAQNAAQPVMQ